LAGEPCVIQSDLLEDVKLAGPTSVQLLKKGNKWVLTLKKGQNDTLKKVSVINSNITGINQSIIYI
jgi:hypothetical protein